MRASPAVRVCLMIEGQEGVTWDEWLTLALAAEEHGFDALFRSDHYVSFGHPDEWGSLDAWATLTALAARTERIRLGTLVSPVTFRHPAELAKVATTADHVSGGRVELGIGAGWFEREHAAYGFDFPPTPQRFGRLEEQVEIVHGLWNAGDAPFSYDGRYYRLDACRPLPPPVQTPHPPIVLGGQAGPKAARLAARFAAEYNVHGKPPADLVGPRDRLLKACEEVGRDPRTLRFSIMTGTIVASDRDELLARARRVMERTNQTGDPATYLDRVAGNSIHGTVEQVLERLAAYRAVGVDRVMLQHLDHGDVEAVALIGAEVIPAAEEL